jgi:hypothetical protein
MLRKVSEGKIKKVKEYLGSIRRKSGTTRKAHATA